MVPRWMLLLTLVARQICGTAAVPSGPSVYIKMTTSTGQSIYLANDPSTYTFLSYTTSVANALLFTIDATTNYVYIPSSEARRPSSFSSGWVVLAGNGAYVEATKENLRDSVSGLAGYNPMTCRITNAVTGALNCVNQGQGAQFTSWAICGSNSQFYNYDPIAYDITSRAYCGGRTLLITAFTAVLPAEPVSSSSSSSITIPAPSSVVTSSSLLSSSESLLESTSLSPSISTTVPPTSISPLGSISTATGLAPLSSSTDTPGTTGSTTISPPTSVTGQPTSANSAVGFSSTPSTQSCSLTVIYYYTTTVVLVPVGASSVATSTGEGISSSTAGCVPSTSRVLLT